MRGALRKNAKPAVLETLKSRENAQGQVEFYNLQTISSLEPLLRKFRSMPVEQFRKYEPSFFALATDWLCCPDAFLADIESNKRVVPFNFDLKNDADFQGLRKGYMTAMLMMAAKGLFFFLPHAKADANCVLSENHYSEHDFLNLFRAPFSEG